MCAFLRSVAADGRTARRSASSMRAEPTPLHALCVVTRMELWLGTTFVVPDTQGTFGANFRNVFGTPCERVLHGDMKPSLLVLFFCGVCAALWATRCLLSSVAMDIPTASREQPTAMELPMNVSIQPALLCWSLFSDSDANGGDRGGKRCFASVKTWMVLNCMCSSCFFDRCDLP